MSSMPSSSLPRSSPSGTRVEGRPSQESSLCHGMHQSTTTHHTDQPSWPPHMLKSERSLAFKMWAWGRCFHCIGCDHQVNSCRDSFRCHQERQCRLRSPSPSHQACSSFVQSQSQCLQYEWSWANIVAMPPSNTMDGPQSQGHCITPLSLRP
jgi:hypothetical protein